MSEREMLLLHLKHILISCWSVALQLTRPLIDCCTLLIMFYLFIRNFKGMTWLPLWIVLFYAFCIYSFCLFNIYSITEGFFYNASPILSQNTRRPFKLTEKLLCTSQLLFFTRTVPILWITKLCTHQLLFYGSISYLKCSKRKQPQNIFHSFILLCIWPRTSLHIN